MTAGLSERLLKAADKAEDAIETSDASFEELLGVLIREVRVACAAGDGATGEHRSFPIRTVASEAVRLVALWRGMKPELVTSRSRVVAVIKARHLALFATAAVTGATLTELTAAFGFGHHSTVISALNRIGRSEALLSEARALAADVQRALTDAAHPWQGPAAAVYFADLAALLCHEGARPEHVRHAMMHPDRFLPAVSAFRAALARGDSMEDAVAAAETTI